MRQGDWVMDAEVEVNGRNQKLFWQEGNPDYKLYQGVKLDLSFNAAFIRERAVWK